MFIATSKDDNFFERVAIWAFLYTPGVLHLYNSYYHITLSNYKTPLGNIMLFALTQELRASQQDLGHLMQGTAHVHILYSRMKQAHEPFLFLIMAK